MHTSKAQHRPAPAEKTIASTLPPRCMKYAPRYLRTRRTYTCEASQSHAPVSLCKCSRTWGKNTARTKMQHCTQVQPACCRPPCKAQHSAAQPRHSTVQRTTHIHR